MDMKFVDGMVEQLKNNTPIPEQEGNILYKMMQDRDMTASALGKVVHHMAEHRETVTNHQGNDELAAQKPIKILAYPAGDDLVLSVVNRTPEADGTYGTYARITLGRNEKGAWQLNSFMTSLDPGGFEKDLAHKYVDIADAVKASYKDGAQQFTAEVLKGLSKGDDMWGALYNADNYGHIDTIFDKTRAAEQKRLDAGGAPQTINKITEGRIPGTFAYFSGDSPDGRRATQAPVYKNGR